MNTEILELSKNLEISKNKRREDKKNQKNVLKEMENFKKMNISQVGELESLLTNFSQNCDSQKYKILDLEKQIESVKPCLEILKNLENIFGILSKSLEVERSDFLNYYNKAKIGLKDLKKIIPKKMRQKGKGGDNNGMLDGSYLGFSSSEDEEGDESSIISFGKGDSNTRKEGEGLDAINHSNGNLLKDFNEVCGSLYSRADILCQNILIMSFEGIPEEQSEDF